MGFMGRHDETSCRNTIELDAEGSGEAGLSVDTMRVACAHSLPGVMRAHRSLLLEHPPAYEGVHDITGHPNRLGSGRRL